MVNGTYKPIGTYHIDASSTNITTAAWLEVTASNPKAGSALEIFNSTSSILQLAVGAAGSEVAIPYYIKPGTSSPVLAFELAGGKRLAVKAIDTDAAAGDLLLNLFG